MATSFLKKHAVLVVSFICTLLWVLFAATMPVVLDEAYYFMWSQFPGLGFFDHPPLVSLVAHGHQLFPTSTLGSRFGTIIVGFLTLLAAIRFFKIIGINDKKSLLVAVICCQFNMFGLIGGFLTTPDTVLILFWVLAVSEAILALNGQRWRWLLVGVFTGMGLWAKYTMLLIGVVFLWALIRESLSGKSSNGLKSPWPYAGGLVALLVFSPHLLWNADNDWITFKFQLRHGFSLDRPEMPISTLPAPEIPDPNGPELALASAFSDIILAQERNELRPKFWEPALKKLNIYLGFYSSQFAIWGLLLFPLIAAWRRQHKNRKDHRVRIKQAMTPGATQIFTSSFAAPLIVFGLISLISKVEANWSAMYVIGAAGLIGLHLTPYIRNIVSYAAANAAIVGLLILHANTGILPLREHRDRILNETHGYGDLAEIAAKLHGGPLFSDSYQIASMLRFYQPKLAIRQWPGITRDSEFLRRPELSDMNYETLLQIGSFWLITSEQIPPKIKGFKPIEMAQLRDCKDAGIQVIKASVAGAFDARCKALIHDWFLLSYTSL